MSYITEVEALEEGLVFQEYPSDSEHEQHFDESEQRVFEIEKKIEKLDAEHDQIVGPSIGFLFTFEFRDPEEVKQMMNAHERMFGARIRKIQEEIRFWLKEQEYEESKWQSTGQRD